MSTLKSSVAPVAILLAALLLSACGGKGTADVKTSTPSSMLGTDSAATKVGGSPVDTTRLGTGQ